RVPYSGRSPVSLMRARATFGPPPMSSQHPALTPDRATSWRRVRQALTFAAGERRAIAATVILSLLVAVIAAAEPLVMRTLIDGLWRHAGTRTLLVSSA